MNEQIFTNYRLQLPDQELLGTLVVREGQIAEIQPGVVRGGHDGEGDYLLPGLIELHTDNLELRMIPRPKVRWPLESAAVFHDRDLISAGITTVCDAIAIGDVEPGSTRMSHFGPMIDVIYQGQLANRFNCDHRIHLRCELSYDQLQSIVECYADHPLLTLISLMDHTPGQRQFVQMDKFKTYYMGKHGLRADEMDQFIQASQSRQQQYGETNRAALVQLAQTRGIPMASHDDATVDHIQEAVANGVVIAEFPTTLAAAKEAHRQRLQILMGAPNLVLGGSHSGNISAMDLVKLDLVDIMSSDYVPQSLLQAVFTIIKLTQLPLFKVIRMVTLHPAKAIHLDHDRGSLTVGKRADLITVHDDGVVPRIQSVVCRGRRVA